MSNHVNVYGTWKETSAQYANVYGVWKTVTNTYANVYGVWKETSTSLSVGDFYQGGYYAGDYGGYKIIAPYFNSITGGYNKTFSGAGTWCAALVLNGYTDWVQAAYQELQLICNARAALESAMGGYYGVIPYWTSTYSSPYYYYINNLQYSCSINGSTNANDFKASMPIRRI
jgi:hypothetical protein